MSSQPSLVIRIGADANGAIREIQNTTNHIQNLGSQVNNTTNHINHYNTTINQAANNTSGLTNAVKLLGGAFVGIKLVDFARDVFKTNVEMQALRTSLETATGSANNARIAFEGIQQFAAKTPYSVKEVSDAFIKLKNLGLSPSEAALTSFGNTASAMNKSLNQMIEAVADAATNQFERLKEFGIKTSVEGNNVKFTFKGIETTVKNSAEAIQGYLLKIGNTDFSGGMDRMSKTMKGALSNLGDSWDAFQDHLLNSNKENAIAQWMMTASNAIGKFDVWLNGASTTVGKIQELQKEQNTLVSSIRAHEQNGVFGGLLDDVYGYDVTLQKNRLEQNKKAIEELKKTLIEEQQINKTITAPIATKGITPEIESLMKNAAQKYNVPSAVFKALADAESSFDNSAKSKTTSATGIFQMTKAAAQDMGTTIEAIYKDVSLSVDKGAGYFSKKLIESKGNLEEAVARFHDGSGAIDKIIKERGFFDKNYVSAEGQAEIEKVIKKTKEYGVEVSNLSKYYDEQEKSAKKSLHEQEQAAKKQQSVIDKLNDNNPLQKYLSDMNDLQALRDKLSPETYLLNEQKIASEFEKSTVDLNAYNQALRERDRLFEQTARGKFENGMDTLRAQKPNMSESEYALKQSNVVDSYLNDTGHKVKKDESEKVTKAYENEWEALQKIRRELTLNDREQYENSQKVQKYGKDRIDALMSEYDAIQKIKFIDDLGLSTRKLASSFSSMFSQVLTQGKSFTNALRDMFKNMVSTISSKLMEIGFSSGNPFAIAGGVAVGLLSSLFGKDKTIDNRLADSATTGTVLGSDAVSHSIQNVTKSLWDINAQQLPELKGINDSFANLTKSIDNTVVKAIQVHGSFVPSTNGMKTTDTGALNKQFVMGLGTTAVSAGLAAAGVGTALVSTAVAAAINASVAITGASSALTGALVSTSASLAAGGLAAAAAMSGIGLLVGGAIYGLGKLLGIGKTKYSTIGNGIVTNAINMTMDGIQGAYIAFDYSTVQAKTKGWFSSKTKIYDVINGIDNEMSNAFGSVFNNLGKSLGASFKYLKIDDLLQSIIQVPNLKIDLSKSKTSQEISDAISGAINSASDAIATEWAGGIFGKFQKMGEGLVETIGRVVKEVSTVQAGFHKLGSEMDLTGTAGLEVADYFAQIYESAPNAADGLKNFTTAINAFYNTIYSKTQQTAFSIKDYQKYVTTDPTGMGLGLSSDPTEVTREQLVNAQITLSKNVEASKTALQPLTDIAQKVQDAFAPFTAGDTFAKSVYAGVGANAGLFVPQGSNINSLTSKDLTTTQLGYLDKFAASGDPAIKSAFMDLKHIIENNDKLIAAALPIVTAAGITGADDYQSKLQAPTSNAKSAVNNETALLNLSSSFDTILNSFQQAYKDLNESALATITTVSQTTQRARDKKYAELDNEFLIASKLSPELVAGFQKINGAMAITTQSFAKYADRLADTKAINDKQTALKLSLFNAYATDTQKTANDLALSIKDLRNNFVDLGDGSLAKLIDLTTQLSDATRYNNAIKSITDFKKSIGDWVTGLKTTSFGTTKDQFNASRTDFYKNISTLNDKNASATNKADAMSKMTGSADKLIENIHRMYANGSIAQKMINDVMSQMQGLPDTMTLEQMSLSQLEQIQKNTLAMVDAFQNPSAVNDTSYKVPADIVPITKNTNQPVVVQQNNDAIVTVLNKVDASINDGHEALLERIEKLERALVVAQSKTTNVTQQTGEKITVNQKAFNLK